LIEKNSRKILLYSCEALLRDLTRLMIQAVAKGDPGDLNTDAARNAAAVTPVSDVAGSSASHALCEQFNALFSHP